MRRITSRWVAGLCIAVLSLGVALCLVSPCHAQTYPLSLQQIDKNSIAIITSSPSYSASGTWDVSSVLDLTVANPSFYLPGTGVTDQFVTDYASDSQGPDTFIQFDLGTQYTLSAILFTDRTTSGGGNGAFAGGAS